MPRPTPRESVLEVLSARPAGYETKEIYFRHRGGYTRSTITRALQVLHAEGVVSRRPFFGLSYWWHLEGKEQEQCQSST